MSQSKEVSLMDTVRLYAEAINRVEDKFAQCQLWLNSADHLIYIGEIQSALRVVRDELEKMVLVRSLQQVEYMRSGILSSKAPLGRQELRKGCIDLLYCIQEELEAIRVIMLPARE